MQDRATHVDIVQAQAGDELRQQPCAVGDERFVRLHFELEDPRERGAHQARRLDVGGNEQFDRIARLGDALIDAQLAVPRRIVRERFLHRNPHGVGLQPARAKLLRQGPGRRRLARPRGTADQEELFHL